MELTTYILCIVTETVKKFIAVQKNCLYTFCMKQKLLQYKKYPCILVYIETTACFPFRLILVSRLLLYYHPQLNQRRILTNLRRRISKLVSHENLQFVAFFGTKQSSFYHTLLYNIIQFIGHIIYYKYPHFLL